MPSGRGRGMGGGSAGSPASSLSSPCPCPARPVGNAALVAASWRDASGRGAIPKLCRDSHFLRGVWGKVRRHRFIPPPGEMAFDAHPSDAYPSDAHPFYPHPSPCKIPQDRFAAPSPQPRLPPERGRSVKLAPRGSAAGVPAEVPFNRGAPQGGAAGTPGLPLRSLRPRGLPGAGGRQPPVPQISPRCRGWGERLLPSLGPSAHFGYIPKRYGMSD